jgi:hypothetical protein
MLFVAKKKAIDFAFAMGLVALLFFLDTYYDTLAKQKRAGQNST